MSKELEAAQKPHSSDKEEVAKMCETIHSL